MSNYLMHYGVKGMKWGVRKADYNTPGMKSQNVFEQLDSLERQENKAYSENAAKYRSEKKRVKDGEREPLNAAKSANKSAKIASRDASKAATKYSMTHPISQHIKKSKSSAKMEELRGDAERKAKAASEAKDKLRISKETYRNNVRAGNEAARKVFDSNNVKIRDNFDKAYYDVLDAGKLATVKNNYKTWNLFTSEDSPRYKENSDKIERIEDAEERRRRFAETYTKNNYRG